MQGRTQNGQRKRSYGNVFQVFLDHNYTINLKIQKKKAKTL